MGEKRENLNKEEEEKKEEQKLIEKGRKTSIKEASAYSFMDGFGLRYISPFAIAIGANNFVLGLLNSLPSLLGSFSQLLTIKAMNKWKRKKIVFWAVFLQAIMWLALIAIGSLYFVFNIHTQLPAYGLVITYTLLILFGAFGGPAWTSWMKDLVKTNQGDYFSKRGRIAGLIALTCMIIAGFILDYFKHTKIFIGFFILFFIAFLGRFTSSMLIKRQYEPDFKYDNSSYFSFLAFIKKMRYNNFGRFVLYFSLVSLATAIVSPFFAVLMLKQLQFSYTQYMIITLASSLSSLLFVVPWGKFADKYGNLKVMHITGIMTPFVPLLWLAAYLLMGTHHIFSVLFLIELFSGLSWAGFNLAAGNFIYDAVTRQRLAICVSYFSILSGIGVLIGSTLGAFLSTLQISFLNIDSLLLVFFVSGIGRVLVYLIYDKRLQEVRVVEKFDKTLVINNLKNKAKKITERINNMIKSISVGKFSETNIADSSKPRSN